VTVYFCDSNALVKCYVQTHGSAWMRTLLDLTTGHRLYLASITGVEVIAAVTRRLRRGILQPRTALQPWRSSVKMPRSATV
jgi:hypothetical protein